MKVKAGLILIGNILVSVLLRNARQYLYSSVKDVDLDYFFIDYVEGTACDAPISGSTTATTVMDLAKFNIHLSNLRFPLSGSLFPSEDGVHVGAWVNTSFCQAQPPFFFGPFKSDKDRYLAWIDAAIQAIQQGQCLVETCLSAYLVHLKLRELVKSSAILSEESGEFYIKHADDKGDHIMVDGQGHITAVIDWEWYALHLVVCIWLILVMS
jgi:hypothetical protein